MAYLHDLTRPNGQKYFATWATSYLQEQDVEQLVDDPRKAYTPERASRLFSEQLRAQPSALSVTVPFAPVEQRGQLEQQFREIADRVLLERPLVVMSSLADGEKHASVAVRAGTEQAARQVAEAYVAEQARQDDSIRRYQFQGDASQSSPHLYEYLLWIGR